jgi:16S rRNA (uracil1498-N3)-methyltransferase
MQRIYLFLSVNIFIASIEENTAILTPEESFHCTKVLRKKSGDLITCIDGLGNFYNCELLIVSEKKTEAIILGGPKKQMQKNYRLHLAIAPTKQIDRIEWMIEKAVEIGVDEITFLHCKNSERTNVNIDRLKKIVESAVKQSLLAYIPKVNGLVLFNYFIQNTIETQRYIAHCFEQDKSDIRTHSFQNSNNLFLIGPEGDFTMEEIQQAIHQNFSPITLGKNRLRSETAGLYVCQAVSLLS